MSASFIHRNYLSALDREIASWGMVGRHHAVAKRPAEANIMSRSATPSERGRADVFRQSGDPGRCEKFAEAYELINYLYRPEVAARNSDFSFLRQRQLGEPEADRPENLNDKKLPRGGDTQETVRDHLARSGHPAYHQSAVDPGEDGRVGRLDCFATLALTIVK